MSTPRHFHVHGYTASGEQVTVTLDLAELRRLLDPNTGSCVVCHKALPDYEMQYALYGPLADFCSQECHERVVAPPSQDDSQEVEG